MGHTTVPQTSHHYLPKLFLRGCHLWRTKQTQIFSHQHCYCGLGTCFPLIPVLLTFDPTRWGPILCPPLLYELYLNV